MGRGIDNRPLRNIPYVVSLCLLSRKAEDDLETEIGVAKVQMMSAMQIKFASSVAPD